MSQSSSFSEEAEATSSSNCSSSSSSDGSTSTSDSTSSDVDVVKIDAHFNSGRPFDGKFRKPLSDKTSKSKNNEPNPIKPKPRKIRTAETTRSTLFWEKINTLLSNPQARKTLVHVPEPDDRIRVAPLDSTGFYSKAISLEVGFPVHPFFISILKFYEIAPAQLNPFAWCHMMGIFLIWSDLDFGEPSLNIWHHLYRTYPIKNHPQFYYFSRWPKGRETLIKKQTSSSGGWRERFFYLDVASGGPGLREEFSNASGCSLFEPKIWFDLYISFASLSNRFH